MDISRAQLKTNAKNILSNKSILIVIMLVYSIATSIISFFGSILAIIPFIGPLIFLGTMAAIYVFSFQITKLNMDATNNEEIDFFNFKKIKKAIFVSLWNFLYMLPGIIMNIIGIFGLLFSTLAVNRTKYVDIGDDIIFCQPVQEITVPVFLILLFVLLLIAGTIYTVYIAYSLMFALYLVYDGNIYDNLTAKEIINKCFSMMKGNKFKLFVLELSFIGWYFLVGIISAIPLLGWILSPIATAVLSTYVVLTQIQFYKTILPVEDTIMNLNLDK